MWRLITSLLWAQNAQRGLTEAFPEHDSFLIFGRRVRICDHPLLNCILMGMNAPVDLPASPFDLEVDALLLASLRRKDRAAQAEIYRRFERPMFTLLRRMLSCPDTAMDLMQDSFIVAFDRLPQFRGEAPFGRWLRAIAVSQVLMHLRSSRRWVSMFEQAMEDAEAPPLDELAQHDLERLLGLLPALPRAVLWLYHVEGYTHVEIAAAANRTVSFSKSQLARAHQRLREMLEAPTDAVVDAVGVLR